MLYGIWLNYVKYVEIVKEGTFGGIYVRDINSAVNNKWYKKSWKEFGELKILIKIVIDQIIMMSMLIIIKLNVGHH